MWRRMRATMELTVADIAASPSEVHETEPLTVARVLEGVATTGVNQELFAGTGLLLQFVEARAVGAEWITDGSE